MDACVANIGSAGRAQRGRFGWVMLVVGVATSAWMIASGITGPWRWSVFLVFLLGATGVFQARAHT